MAKITSQTTREPSTPTQDDKNLRDLRAKYEHSLLKHNEAKARLNQSLAKNTQHADATNVFGKGPGVTASRQKHLETHLEHLRLQRRYRNLRLLSQYAEQADQIASDEGIFDIQERSARALSGADDPEQQATLAATQKRLEALRSDVGTRTTELEIALVKARQQLKMELNLLERARNRSKANLDGALSNGSGLAKQRAMEATRDELQNWIAESLARCEREISLPETHVSAASTGDIEQSEADVDGAIDTEYGQYLEIRLQLVHSAKTLRAPLVDTDDVLVNSFAPSLPTEPKSVTENQRMKPSVQRAPHLRHKSRLSIHKFGEHTGGPGLAVIESMLLPKYHHERLLNTHVSYLEGQTTAQDARLLQGLSLLGHESHLLPSYPFSSMDSTRNGSPNDLSQQQIEIDLLLSAWGFASDMADGVLKESVLSNVDETKEALYRAKQHLDDVQIMEDMRKEVAEG